MVTTIRPQELSRKLGRFVVTESTLIWNGKKQFLFSRGVLEADQKRYALKHEIIVKELEAKKQKHEDGLNQLEEEKINLQNREKELERKEEALERNRLELQNNWNHYQKEAEALRTAANSSGYK